jgi:hypothetical protein
VAPNKLNTIWLNAGNPNRIPSSNTNPGGAHDTFWMIGELIVREGPVGIPAPGFVAPPATAYPSIPTFVPATQPDRARLTSVQNGNAAITNALNADWATGNNRGIVDPWSGGAWDYDARVLWWNGGGHSATYNNSIMKYDFNGTVSLPYGWTTDDASVASLVTSGSPNPSYPDNRWCSVHSYSGNCVSADGRVWRAGGSINSSGGCANYLISYTPTTKGYAYYPLAGILNAAFGHIAFYDPLSNKVIVALPIEGRFTSFDCASSQFSTSGSIPYWSFGEQGSASGAYAPATRRLIYFGSGSSTVMKVAIFNGSTFSFTAGDQASAGAVTPTFTNGTSDQIFAQFAPAVCYDPERACFWAMNLSSNQSSPYVPDPEYGQYLWKIVETGGTALTLGAFTFTRYTVTGTAVDNIVGSSSTVDSQKRGGQQSLYVLKGWDALAHINRANDSMYVIRKPA